MLRLLIKEYLSKCKCCDECIAQCYCITNQLRNDLVPRDYCVDNMAEYLEERVRNSNGALSDYISKNRVVDIVYKTIVNCDDDYEEDYEAALDKAIWIVDKWLPPAQSEIITCKECAYWRVNCYEWCAIHGSCMNFCSDAKRREDEYSD